MQQLLKEHLLALDSHQVQQCGGIRILPLVSSMEPVTSYLTLKEALAQSALQITEISESGSVPNLKVRNNCELPVLLLDGEELCGAKQNRILNTSVLVSAKSELIVPVSCTEAGRWSYQNYSFSESGNVLSGKMRAAKMSRVTNNLSQNRGYDADQGEVWNEISSMHAVHGTQSDTGAMHDVYKDQGNKLEEICDSFPCLEGQCGIYVELGGFFAGLDVVSLPSAWQHYHKKIIHSYAIDTLKDAHHGEAREEIKFSGIMEKLSQCKAKTHSSVGLGEDIRLESEKLSGAVLAMDKAIIHAALYPRTHGSARDYYHSPRQRSVDR